MSAALAVEIQEKEAAVKTMQTELRALRKRKLEVEKEEEEAEEEAVAGAVATVVAAAASSGGGGVPQALAEMQAEIGGVSGGGRPPAGRGTPG